ncbi:hypothetical protein [Vibrio cholerae]|uniref:hypothetical protein n=1 Tax=Vibrio cholerae TaxID=666 RepID=UPI00308032E7
MKSGAFGVSAKDGENHVDVLAPLLDELTGEYTGKLHLSVPGTGKVFCGLNHSLFYINAGNLERCNMEELLTQIHNETGKLNSLKSQPPTESNSEIIKAQEQVLDSLISQFDSVMEAKQKSGLKYSRANPA